MSWSPYIGWDVLLSIAAPFVVAAILFLLEKYGPLARPLQKSLNLVGPYFQAVAILFGLFTAQLMTDGWQKDNAAWQAVQAEDDAMRALIQLSRVNELPALVPLIKAYAAAASKENPLTRVTRTNTDQAYESIVETLTHATAMDNASRAFALSTAGELRRARDRRLYLADDEAAPIKWLSILVLGALTQLAIMLVHTGSRTAVRVSVSLFTVAFAFCLVIVAIFDMPFDTVLAKEPGATLSASVKGL